MMPGTPSELGESLTITRTYNAAVSRVYSAWTDPNLLAKWWGPPGMVVKEVEIDLRVGGEYRIGLQKEDDPLLFVSGTYQAIEPQEKLAFTWRWNNPEMDIGSSLVTIEFRGQGDKTELLLVHELLPNAEVCSSHAEGWVGILSELTRYFSEEEG